MPETDTQPSEFAAPGPSNGLLARLRMSEHTYMVVLAVLVGCLGGFGAATFNAPVAGALFAVEIILGDFGVTQFSPIVISSVMAAVVSRHFLGDFPAF